MIRNLLIAISFSVFGASAAHAAVLQMPAGGKSAVERGVVCGPLPEGWSLEADRRTVRASADLRPGAVLEAHVAADVNACAASRETVTWVATGPWPTLEPASIVLWADEGRLEWKGARLKGIQVHWQSGRLGGDDACLDPLTTAGIEHCVAAVGRGVPVDVQLSWLPAGARRGEDVTSFDLQGRKIPQESLVLRPARTVLARVLPATTAVDLTDGVGRLPLPHPEAVAGVDCGAARCELGEAAVLVRGVTGLANSVVVKVRLAPHVFVQRGDAFETTASATFALVHCPIALASGPPLRDLDDVRAVVRMDARCSKDPRALRWTADGDPADVLKVEKVADAYFILLRLGRLEDDRVTLVATRQDPDAPVLAAVTEKTQAPPQPRAALELPGLGPIEFVPRNRDALVRVAPVDEHTRLAVLPVAGVYAARAHKDGYLVRGENTAGGFVALRYGVRVDTLPTAFQGTNLGVLNDPLQRPVREASVPVALAGSPPIVELLCNDGEGDELRLPGGPAVRLPFVARDSCRIVVHRSRLKPEDGAQDINVEVDVVSLDGTPRAGGHIGERVVLRPGVGDRVFWIHGVKAPFDRINARVYQIADESRYQGGPELKTTGAALQWTVIMGTGRVRFYATAAFPTGLYRVTEPTGLLSLNFGVLSRLALLDHEGREGLIGIELGAIGVGLIGNGNFPNYPQTLATVAGLGISIPLGNAGQPTQASLNLHAWAAYEFRKEFQYYPSAVDATAGKNGRPAPHWAFVFGPSISIGNIGLVL